jgi:hypothetical protein
MVVQPNAIFNRKREGQIVKVLTAKTGWGMLVQDQSGLFSLRSDPTTLFRPRTGSNERDQRGLATPLSLNVRTRHQHDQIIPFNSMSCLDRLGGLSRVTEAEMPFTIAPRWLGQ